MTEERLTPAERTARNEIRNFSIRALHHDPEEPEQGQRVPHVLLDYVDERMDARERRKKYKGALLVAASSAFGALIVGKFSWLTEKFLALINHP